MTLTISSVDAAANTLTVTAHGLSTGDGPLTIYTAAGTYPSPLTAVTDVYAIRVDANTLKLAVSSANALASTAIDLTTAGSGTLLLLKGLPYRRPRTAVPGQQVFSADLNSVWDSLIALWNLLTAQAQSVYSSVALAVPIVGNPTFTDGLIASAAITANASIAANAGLIAAANQDVVVSGTGKFKYGTVTEVINAQSAADPAGTNSRQVGGGGWTLGTSTDWILFQIKLPVGRRLLSWSLGAYKQSASGTILAQLMDGSLNGISRSEVQIGSNQSNAANNPGSIALGQSGLTTVYAAGHSYFVRCHGGGVTGDQLNDLTITYDQP